MPFTKGTPKPPGSGRKKGQPNNITKDVRARLQELGCDPIAGLAKIAEDENAEMVLRARCYSDLLPYAYPKLGSIDVKHTGEITAMVKRVIGVPDDEV